MFDTLKFFFGFFFDASQKIWHKIIALIVICLLLWAIDGILGFSSFSFTNKKIETIKNINTLLKDPTLDSSIKIKLKKELVEVNNKKSAQTQLSSLYDRFFGLSVSSINNNKKIVTSNIKPPYDIFWLIASSVGINLFFGGWSILQKRKTNLAKALLDFLLLFLFNYLLFLAINALPVFTGYQVIDRYYSNLIYQISSLVAFALLMTIVLWRLGKFKPKQT